MNENKILVGVLVAGLLVAGAVFLTPPQTVNVQVPSLGASGIGSDIYTSVEFHERVGLKAVGRGVIKTLTSGAAVTATGDDICKNSILKFLPTATAGVFQLPTSSLMIGNCLFQEGDSIEFVVNNINPLAASTTVITAGASTTVHAASSTLTGQGFLILRTYYTSKASATLDVYQVNSGL